MDDDFDKRYIKGLEFELQGRIEVATGKTEEEVGSVLEVDLTLSEQE